MQTPQPLNGEAVSYIKEAIKMGCKPYYALTLEQAREQSRSVAQKFQGQSLFKGERTEVFVPSAHWQDTGIPAYLYKPSSLAKDAAIFVYVHGGGLVVGSRNAYDALCGTIAERTGCIVVNTDYRLAPEHKFPAMFEDVTAVVKWVIENKEKLGGGAGSPVGVGGDSGGATLASSVCHDIPELDFQVLIYPRLMNGFTLTSHKEYENGPLLSKKLVEWFESQSNATPEDSLNPRNRALYRPKFEHLPATLIIVAQCDLLRDEGCEYRRKLEEAKVPVDFLVIEGATHAFIHLQDIFPTSCTKAWDKIVDFICQRKTKKV